MKSICNSINLLSEPHVGRCSISSLSKFWLSSLHQTMIMGSTMGGSVVRFNEPRTCCYQGVKFISLSAAIYFPKLIFVRRWMEKFFLLSWHAKRWRWWMENWAVMIVQAIQWNNKKLARNQSSSAKMKYRRALVLLSWYIKGNYDSISCIESVMSFESSSTVINSIPGSDSTSWLKCSILYCVQSTDINRNKN